MTTIITRSALMAWGHVPQPDLHSIVDGSIVTWKEVLDARRTRQSKTLLRIRRSDQWQVWRLYVEYFDQRLMGGWQCMLDRYDGMSTWVDRDARHLKERLMTLFPLTMLGWDEWKVDFASAFQRGKKCRRPRGVSIVWRLGDEIQRFRKVVRLNPLADTLRP